MRKIFAPLALILLVIGMLLVPASPVAARYTSQVTSYSSAASSSEQPPRTTSSTATPPSGSFSRLTTSRWRAAPS